jgi:hypothetical protein
MSDAASGRGPAAARGGCACGAVRYEVRGPLRPVVYCHCSLCRRTSGHFVAATACAREHLVMVAADGLRWYASSAAAQRGFCARCGSNLFWNPLGEPRVSIMAGTLDKPTGLKAAGHIFVADAGDYYRIDDGLPQSAGWGQSLAVPEV